MDNKQSSDKQFALLIDADNVSAKYIKPILNELSKYGTVTYKRIYGDWTQALHAKWKDSLLENSITPIQQFSYTYGKNATDSAMIIDAMDILYSNDVNGFCIVSSDSDFTRLASRLRESGVTVIGMGEKKTPTPFRKACDIFTTLELLIQNRRTGRNENSNFESSTSKEEVEQAVVDIITDNQNNGKATGLGEVGSRLQKRYPDFDVRSYGTNLLSKLLEEFDRVTITKTGNSVTVELAEGASHEASSKSDAPAQKQGEDKAATSAEKDASEAKPRRTRRGRSTRKILTPSTASDNASPAEETSSSTAQAEPSASTTHQESESPEGSANDTQSQNQSAPKTGSQTNRRARRRSSESSSEEPSTETTSSEEQSASSPRHRGRSRKSQGETAEAATSHQPEAAEHADKPKEPSTDAQPKAQQAKEPSASAQDAQVEIPAEPKKQQSKSASKTTGRRRGRPRKVAADVTATTPREYIAERVQKSNGKGVLLSELTKELRNRFPGFKVKDLGFTQLRFYFDANKDFTIEKIGSDYTIYAS